jgi:hypothetical protein
MEKCAWTYSYIPPVMLFIFNLHTFIFSSLYVWSQTNEQKMNVIRRHEQTNRKNDKKFNGFLYFSVCCSCLFISLMLCSYDSFFIAVRKLSHGNVKLTTKRELNFAEEEFVSEVINWKIFFVFLWLLNFRRTFV